MPDWRHEDDARRQGRLLIAGIDEAGRGPWAGPVVAGAVILDRDRLTPSLRDGLDDSKKLKPPEREILFAELADVARVGTGRAEIAEIDIMNILQATMLAMARAVADLGAPPPDFALVDGNREPALACDLQCVVKGDSQSLSIAAASIVAKVTRDRVMAELDARYPGYGWARNAGYGTKEHQAALARLGVTPEHRRSFAPIRKILSPE